MKNRKKIELKNKTGEKTVTVRAEVLSNGELLLSNRQVEAAKKRLRTVTGDLLQAIVDGDVRSVVYTRVPESGYVLL
jgi:hypothetical protein